MKTLLLALLLPFSAHAEYAFLCGDHRDAGAAKAELALVQDPESLAMKLSRKGKEVSKDLYETKAGAGLWYVTVFKSKDGAADSRYEFREKPAEVQRFKPGEKAVKVGAAKKCVLKDTETAE
jgi:hypothetical protein